LKRISLLLSLLIGSILINAQVAPDSLFDRSLLIADLDSLRISILRSHPNPFAFTTSETFENAYLTCKNSLNEQTCKKDFLREVSLYLNTLRDSHTSLDYSQFQSLQLMKQGYFLPLFLKRINNGASSDNFDLCSAGEWTSEIPKGSKIVSINGKDIRRLYQESLDFACIEGNSTKAQSTIAVAILPLVTGLNYPFGATNMVSIENTDGSIQELLVAGYDKKGIKKLRKDHLKKEDGYPKLEIDSTMSLGTIRVNTFSPTKSGKYAKRIRRAMQQAQGRGLENLVIDIRGNGGGSSAWVEYLYSFIDTNGYNTPSNVIGKNSQLAFNRNRLFHRDFVQFFVRLFFRKDEDVQSYQHISALPFGSQDTIYFHKPTIQKKQYVYTGNCYLLMNGLTASAGVDFTNAFKTKKRGVVIGEECLGPKTGTWGNPATYVMRNTGIRLTIATIRYNYDNTFEYDPNAIQPDYEVSNNRLDIANNEDTQLKFVKKLIQEKK
jgi:hypothetical protein